MAEMKHPCDMCKQPECDYDCIFDRLKYCGTGKTCIADCIYCHEDSCELNAYKMCGVWLKDHGHIIGGCYA